MQIVTKNEKNNNAYPVDVAEFDLAMQVDCLFKVLFDGYNVVIKLAFLLIQKGSVICL